MAFLGTANYYRKFIPHFSLFAKPLTDLTREAMPRMITWTPASQTAFMQLKKTLTCEPILVAPSDGFLCRRTPLHRDWGPSSAR